MAYSADERHRRYLVDIISEAFNDIIVKKCIPVMSTSLFEFVLRTCVAFGPDGRGRKRVKRIQNSSPLDRIHMISKTSMSKSNTAASELLSVFQVEDDSEEEPAGLEDIRSLRSLRQSPQPYSRSATADTLGAMGH